MKPAIEICIYLGAIFIGNLSYDLCFKEINKEKLKINKKTIITMIITAIIIYINNIYVNIGIKTIITFIVMCINFKIIYKLNIKRTIISYIMIYLILVVLEISITNILSVIGVLKNNTGAIALTYIKITLSIIIGIIEYIIISIPKVNREIEKIIKIFENYTDIISVIYIIFITMTILGILNIDNFATKNSTKLIIGLVIIFAILFTIIIKTKTEEEILKASNKRLIDYNEKYGQFLDEYKIYKHNIKNKLKGIKSYGNKKVKELIEDILEEETTFSIKNNNLYKVPKGIKGIVAEKLYNPEINVIINNKIEKDPFIKLKAKEFNSISEAIGICIDNAIEANEGMEERIITIELKEDKEAIYIKIGNNFKNNIDIEELGDKYYSTKNRGSGLGLFSIKRNKLIKEHISIINDFYYIELQIKKAR